MTPNAQHPGPAKVQRFAHETGPCVTVPLTGARFIVARVNRFAAAFGDKRDEANARLLASAYTCLDRAGRELGIDASELAERIDLAALIRSARRAYACLGVLNEPGLVPDDERKALIATHLDELERALASVAV